MRYYTKSMPVQRTGWLLEGKEGMFHSPQTKVPESLKDDFLISHIRNDLICPWNSHKPTGSRIIISIVCVPLVAGYVRPPQLLLPNVDDTNISCNPPGPHLVCVLPAALSSSYCIPAWYIFLTSFFLLYWSWSSGHKKLYNGGKVIISLVALKFVN